MNNWEKLFSTPTKTARTIVEKDLIYQLTDECESCPKYDECKDVIFELPCPMDDEDAVLRWLNDD